METKQKKEELISYLTNVGYEKERAIEIVNVLDIDDAYNNLQYRNERQNKLHKEEEELV